MATPGAIAVTAYVSRIRQAQGIPPRCQGRRLLLPVAEPVSQPLTPRRATWLSSAVRSNALWSRRST